MLKIWKPRKWHEKIFLLSLAFLMNCSLYLYLLRKNCPTFNVVVEPYPSHLPSLLASFGNGRLGNQLSSFATIYGLSLQNGYKPMVTQEQAELLMFYFEPPIESILHVLEKVRDVIIGRVDGAVSVWRLNWETPWPGVPNVPTTLNFSKASDPNLLKGRALTIGAYPNDVESYYKVLPEIRRKFQLKEIFKNFAKGKLCTAKQGWLETHKNTSIEPVFVGVHIRRTDYEKHLKGLYNLTLVEVNYFYDAMQFYRNRFPSALFAVVSDDLPWARENMVADDVYILGSTENPKEDIGKDLALLATCNHTIMSYGTFGMWGSLLAGGMVVVPRPLLDTKEGKELAAAGLFQDGSQWHII